MLGNGSQLSRAGIDIHCGGMDLVFSCIMRTKSPRAAPPAWVQIRYWLHNGWVTMGGEKMSKSLGNVVHAGGCCSGCGRLISYYLGSAHYRSMLEFSEYRYAGCGESLAG